MSSLAGIFGQSVGNYQSTRSTTHNYVIISAKNIRGPRYNFPGKCRPSDCPSCEYCQRNEESPQNPNKNTHNDLSPILKLFCKRIQKDKDKDEERKNSKCERLKTRL